LTKDNAHHSAYPWARRQRAYADRMGLQQALYDAFLQGTNQFHKAVLALSGGRLMSTISGMQAVELHTTGRKSGQRRSVMLTAPVYEPNRVVLVASKGGDDRDPEWYRNLVANPDVDLEAHGTIRPMRARTATDDERAELWPKIIKAYRGYDAYQRRTDRQIPIVIVEPR
jgi:deazaflavin-dependent oxidoreductase (nitroreductase family)